jgi:U32 family peptidase
MLPLVNGLPELLLPAGSFDSAIAAVEGGADALYLGFSEFSARRQAKNFDRLEYRRLHRLARDKGIRLYVTLNTVVLQSEFSAVAELLAFLGRFPPDAILVQDWGLARLIRERHPGISIHASTQTASQGVGAARLARELGASRIVLPRETSLAEMRALHEAEPDLELECFVHGALCYSFSGLCLASGLVLGRSGNRGECAQLCRSYYDVERPSDDSGARRGYWFSCRDLELGGSIRELAEAGIVSLKVEGRMKSPEYCYAVARLYRGYIDGLAGQGSCPGPSEEEMAARLDAARVAFSRSPTEGWLLERGGSRLIDSAYPGHRGVPAGRIEKVQGNRLFVELSRPIGLRDGLLAFESRPASQGADLDPPRALRFPALGLRDERTGRELSHARTGSQVELELPQTEGKADEGRPISLKPGDELRLISSRESDRRAVSPEEYESARDELGLSLSIGEEGMGATLSLPRFDGLSSAGNATISPSDPIPLDLAKSSGGFERGLKLFSESGDYDFLLVPCMDREGEILLPDGRKIRFSELFVPPSALKREKNRIYEEAAERIADAQMAYARESLKLCDEVAKRSAARPVVAAPPRSALSFPREGLVKGMPFATTRDLAEARELPSWGGRSWLPLAPLVSDRSRYAALALERASALLATGASLAVGIGALHHFELGRALLGRNAASSERLSFFLDVNLYVANGLAWESLSALLPGVEFAYRYLELKDEEGETESLPLVPAGADFEPPLFQSLGCLLKQQLHKCRCPDNCGRSWSTALSDRSRRYRVLVEDCVTYFFRA